MSVLSVFGVCVIDPPGKNYPRTINYPGYIHEILAHAGICYESIDQGRLTAVLPQLKLLLTVGDAPEGSLPAQAIRDWVKGGGCWISIGGTCGLSDVLGVEQVIPGFRPYDSEISCLGEGYLHVSEDSHRIVDHINVPLHYFGGVKLRETSARVLAGTSDKHQRETPFAAIATNDFGNGRTVVIAPDVCGTVVRIQQGIGVTRDAVASGDGLISCDDGLLKTEDGITLDWIFDRQEVPGVPGFNAFLEPIADQWQEILIRAIFEMAEYAEVSLPLLWFYPHGVPAVGHISHDSDANNEELASEMLRVLAENELHSTWCIIPPGYGKEMIGRIRDAGHELAMHYDAFESGPWSEDEFRKQLAEITELFGGVTPVSNKNHYLRWEGDMEFFEWCERAGIKLDQSKGATKIGESGFCFGTSHPHFPVKWSQEAADVLELPTFMFDLVAYIPKEIMPPLIRSVLAHHGVLHLLFHPAHIDKPGVEDALGDTVRVTREAGMAWYTSEEISNWERARRNLRWEKFDDIDGGVSIRFSCKDNMQGATIMWLAPEKSSASMDGKLISPLELKRWGFRFKGFDFDIEASSEHTLEIKS